MLRVYLAELALVQETLFPVPVALGLDQVPDSFRGSIRVVHDVADAT